MKNLLKITCLLLATAIVVSCSDFSKVNRDPTAANEDQVQVEYFINHSIIGTQMHPGVAERSFILYWKIGAHQAADVNNTFSWGSYNRSEEHTSELQSRFDLVCRLLLEK